MLFQQREHGVFVGYGLRVNCDDDITQMEFASSVLADADDPRARCWETRLTPKNDDTLDL